MTCNGVDFTFYFSTDDADVDNGDIVTIIIICHSMKSKIKYPSLRSKEIFNYFCKNLLLCLKKLSNEIFQF